MPATYEGRYAKRCIITALDNNGNTPDGLQRLFIFKETVSHDIFHSFLTIWVFIVLSQSYVHLYVFRCSAFQSASYKFVRLNSKHSRIAGKPLVQRLLLDF
jgi:hypothetical protein